MRIWSRLKRTLRGDAYRDEIDEELRFHLDADVAGGRSARDARHRLGNPERVADDVRAARILPWLDAILRDGRDSLRKLRAVPLLSLAIVLSLAIGIGANTAIFSLIDAAVLRPLPVADPDSLVFIEWTDNGFAESVGRFNGYALRSTSDGRLAGQQVSAAFHRRLAREQTGFEAIVGMSSPSSMPVTVGEAAPESAALTYVSSNFFQGLGVTPVLGRAFVEEDDELGRAPVAVISHRFWMSRFGGSAEALGQSIVAGDTPVQIVGVAPPGFFGFRSGVWVDVYAPLAARGVIEFWDFASDPIDDRFWWVHQVGRLRDDIPASAALDELASVFGRLVAEIASELEGPVQLASAPASRGVDALGEEDLAALGILQLLVGVLILLVSANVANLLLSRAERHRHESALRLALGASRARLFQRSFVESALLAAAGGAVGLVMGYVLARGIHDLFQTGRGSSNLFDLGIDLRVVGFVVALSIFTTLLFGVAPAVHATRAHLNQTLKGRSRSIASGRMRLPRLLVSLQVALCLVAVVAAGLLGRSLGNLAQLDVGLETENLVYATVNPWLQAYTTENVSAYAESVATALRQLPGVESASALEMRALERLVNLAPAGVPGRERRRDGPFDLTDAAFTNRVGGAAFETLGIELISGRALTGRDATTGARYAVVDERFVRHFFDGGPVLGRQISLNIDNSDRYEIVGVARNTQWSRLRDDDWPMVYLPYRPDDGGALLHFGVRSSLPLEALAEPVRRAVAAVDPAVTVTELRTQASLMDGMLRTERLLAYISSGFGLWAVLLTAIGLSGLLAYAVARRTNEIGVRIALGAGRADVIRMVIRDSLGTAGLGLLIGLPCAYWVGKLLSSTLFELAPLDPLTTASAVSVLLIVTLAAASIPARRAAAIEPVAALREE